MLEITNLRATVAGKPILNGLTLTVPTGEIHAIMGPNGSGKSTLAYVLGGRPGYAVTGGSVTYSPLPPEREGSTREASAGGPVLSPDDRPSPSSLRSSSPPALAGGESFLSQTWPADPVKPPPRRYERVAIGVDPPTGGGTCGIVACAVDHAGHGHVLADHSVTGASPEGWARAVVAAVAAYAEVCSNGAIVVAEINQGGAMVKSVLRKAGLTAFIKAVHAKEGKANRAVPIAMLLEQGRVSLHGEMAMLEEELGGLLAGAAYQGPGASPDRADAMVWALGEVMTRRVVRVSGF